MNYYIQVWKKFAQFEGRARRSEYWYFALFHFMIVFGYVLLLALVTGGFQDDAPPLLLMIPLGLYVLASIIPGIAVTVRRLHDIGKSGWWYLINFIPYVGGIVLLIFCVQNSEHGPNKWGPNPKGLGNHEEIDEIGKTLD